MPSWNETIGVQQRIERHTLYKWYQDIREAAQKAKLDKELERYDHVGSFPYH